MAYPSKERPIRDVFRPRPEDYKDDDESLLTKIRDLLTKKAAKRGQRS